ncbi:hypothetical protein ABZ128_35015 [Streptomyces sp. NPDC006326]|uniref:hypothetical protein n=1 Tax=Streptomyces sp. NPDC006326 TaxID=3156752 RepID=UPI0033A05F83
MAADRHQRIRRAFTGAALGCAVTFLLASCSVYPVAINAVDQLTGVWSSYNTEATVEFKDDGTFTGKGLDKSDLGTFWCSGIADRQHGTWSHLGNFTEVTFDGVDCEGMQFAFYGSQSHFIACFTRDVTSGCTEEFRKADPSDPGPEPTT